MVQKTDVFGHVPGGQEAIQKVNTWYDVNGVAVASRPPPHESVVCVCVLDSFLVPWNVAEDVGVLYHVCLSVLSPTPVALPGLELITRWREAWESSRREPSERAASRCVSSWRVASLDGTLPPWRVPFYKVPS